MCVGGWVYECECECECECIVWAENRASGGVVVMDVVVVMLKVDLVMMETVTRGGGCDVRVCLASC